MELMEFLYREIRRFGEIVINNLTFRWSAFPIVQRENAQFSTTTLSLFPLRSHKSILTETERYLNGKL